MRKIYKIHLRNGTVLKVKGDDFTVKYNSGGFTEWHIDNTDHWLMFLPSDLLAVERVR